MKGLNQYFVRSFQRKFSKFENVLWQVGTKFWYFNQVLDLLIISPCLNFCLSCVLSNYNPEKYLQTGTLKHPKMFLSFFCDKEQVSSVTSHQAVIPQIQMLKLRQQCVRG